MIDEDVYYIYCELNMKWIEYSYVLLGIVFAQCRCFEIWATITTTYIRLRIDLTTLNFRLKLFLKIPTLIIGMFSLMYYCDTVLI